MIIVGKDSILLRKSLEKPNDFEKHVSPLRIRFMYKKKQKTRAKRRKQMGR